MADIWSLWQQLWRPKATNPRNDEQVERALKWILVIAVAGLLAIAVLALGRPQGLRIPFFGVAALAAFMALAVGAALGLLFGLPWRIAAAGPVSTSATPPTGTPAPTASAPTDGWYKDNTSLEQIAQWLTTSIVALSLVNFDGWVGRFERAATAVTCGMYEGIATRSAAAGPVPLATAQCGPAPGGIILAMYATLGLLAGYLWARRYLMKEFSSAITEARRVAEQKWLDSASASGLVQSAKQTELPTDQRELAKKISDAGPLGDIRVIEPGPSIGDPWKGQFGGQATSDKVRLSGTVTPLVSRPGLYRLELLVSPLRDDLRSTLATQSARVYLHPTFGDPIRTVQFDLTGQIRIPLIAYGAFTVGVQLWDDTRVELDLAQLPDAPAEFRAR